MGDRLDADTLRDPLQLGPLDQGVDGFGRRTETVAQFREQHRRVLRGVRQATVDLQPQRDLADVVLRYRHGRGQADRRGRNLRRRLAAQFGDRMLQHLHVGLDADLRDMTALLGAKQVTRATDLQVAGGDPETRPELRELADRQEPLARLCRQHGIRRRQQIAVAQLIAAAHPAPQLVELRQAEPVRAVHEHRVDVRNVDSVLDDRRRQQQVVVARGEGAHAPAQLGLLHLPVTDGDPEPRDQLAQIAEDPLDVLDPVVDVEHLASALHLELDRLAHEVARERQDPGLHRHPVARRRFDQGQVPHARQRQLQGARHRRRRHREHVDVAPEFAQPLLLGDAEALLLVDHDQTQARHVDVPAEQPVRADQDVNLPGGEAGPDRPNLGRRPKPRHHLDLDVETLESPPEGPQMLVGEDRRRRQDRDLQPVVDRLERRPHRDFRLAETDVAAEQAVHRPVAGEVLLDRPYGFQLIGRFLVGEGALELELPVAVLVHGDRLRQPALRVELQQVGRDRLQTAPDPALLFRPAAPAQLVQAGRDALDAAVTLDLVQASQRQEQGPPRRVEKLHHLDRARLLLPERIGRSRRTLAGRTVEGLEPQELTDAVILVDHELADAQIAQTGDEGTHPAATAARGEPLAEELTLAVEHETGVRQPEAPRQFAVDQPHRAAVPVDLTATQRLAERLVPFGTGHQPEVVAARAGCLHFTRETGKLIDQHVRLDRAEVDADAPPSRRRIARSPVERPADPERRPLDELQHLVRRHRQPLRLGRDLAVVAAPPVLLPQQPGVLFDLPAHPLGIDHDHRSVRHHLAEARARLEQGQVLLPAVEGFPRRHLLQLGPSLVRQVAATLFQQQRRQIGRPLRPGDEGRQRPDPERLDRLLGTLSGRIEAVNALDRVAEQVETRRSGFARREEIEHAAPLRHRTDRRHEVATPVAVGEQTGQELFGRGLAADLEFDH